VEEGFEEKSRLLSFVLRHRPEHIGIRLDGAGWTDVAALLAALERHGTPLSRQELEAIVADSDKQRFALSPDSRRIRANQGHSVPVDLELEPAVPPDILYHGTTRRFLGSILRNGLHRGKRHHVHLHAETDTALAVGGRRGDPVVLVIDAASMSRDGHDFFLTENAVWLTDAVPPAYITVGG